MGNPKKNKLKPSNSFLQYSGLGMQMAVIIGGMAWLGNYLDERAQKETPVFTIVLSLIGVAAGLYLGLKGIISRSE